MNTQHTSETFEAFMAQLKETNATLAFYSDFRKIACNVDEVAISLHMLNFLLGKDDLRAAIEMLWNRDPKAFDVMDILIATRKKENRKYLDANGEVHFVHHLFESPGGIMLFLEETGLADVFRRGAIKDLTDYVFGVETGLDTNARKNRSGSLTEDLVAGLFAQAHLNFQAQVSSAHFPPVAATLGADQKIFDFAIYTSRTTYLVEVNFYSGGGSKLNEVARAYTEIGPKINRIDGFEFVWITDGVGWKAARNKLEEAYYAIPNLYNLSNVGAFIRAVGEE